MGLLESVSPARFRGRSAGQIFQVLSQDIEQIRALIGFALLQIGNIIIAMAILVPKMWSFDPRLLWAMIPQLVAFGIFTVIVSKNRENYRKTQDLQGEVQNFLIESYAGKKTIRNFHAEEEFFSAFKSHSWSELINFYRASNRVSFSVPLVPLGVGLSLLWGAYIIQQENLGASALVLFSGFIFLFLEPLMFLSWIGMVFARSHGSWARVQELSTEISTECSFESEVLKLNQDLDTKAKEFTIQIPFWNKIVPIHFVRGEWNVLIAKTGHGKTHALSCVGEVMRIKQADLSYVAQEPYLYNDTIEGNIFLGRTPSADDRELACELLGLMGLEALASDSRTLLDLEVGENGKRLSGGQAKRVALVRSLLAGASLLLWDDPFSSIDLASERSIISKLRQHPRLKDITILLTSHRLSTARQSDAITYLDKNEGVIERGQVRELLQVGHRTYEYFEEQMV
jgi:ATP-binding cassette subfamily B protein